MTQAYRRGPPPPRRVGVRERIRMGFPSWVKFIVRMALLLSLLLAFEYYDCYAPLEPKVPWTGEEFTLFLAACVAISSVFCLGYLLLTQGRRGHPGKEADIPSMLLVLLKTGVSIGIAYAAYLLDVIPRFAMLFIVAILAAFWALFATATYTYYAFRRIH